MFIKYVSVMSEKMYVQMVSTVRNMCVCVCMHVCVCVCVCVRALHIDGTGAEEGSGEDEQRGT